MTQQPPHTPKSLDALDALAARMDNPRIKPRGPSQSTAAPDTFEAIRKADPARAGHELTAVSARVSNNKRRALRRHAADLDTTVSEILSTLIDEYLKRQNIAWDE